MTRDRGFPNQDEAADRAMSYKPPFDKDSYPPKEQKPQSKKSINLIKLLGDVEAQLPWPTDVFGEVPKDDWSKIDEFATRTLGYRIDTISATLMRRGWGNYRRLLREQVNDLVEQGFVITTDTAYPPTTSTPQSEKEQ